MNGYIAFYYEIAAINSCCIFFVDDVYFLYKQIFYKSQVHLYRQSPMSIDFPKIPAYRYPDKFKWEKRKGAMRILLLSTPVEERKENAYGKVLRRITVHR